MCTSFRVLNRLKYQEILCDNLIIQDVKILNNKVKTLIILKSFHLFWKSGGESGEHYLYINNVHKK